MLNRGNQSIHDDNQLLLVKVVNLFPCPAAKIITFKLFFFNFYEKKRFLSIACFHDFVFSQDAT